MKARLFLLALLPPLLAVSATAQQKKSKAVLPAAMVGVWGETAGSCNRETSEPDDRIEVGQSGVETFASYYRVRRWEPQKDGFSGRAVVSEEGEGKPLPGRYRVALRALPDGKIEVRFDRQTAAAYVKCPAGTQLR